MPIVKKCILTGCLFLIIVFGMMDLNFLVTSVKSRGEVLELIRGSKNSVYATVQFFTRDNRVLIGKVNAEGHKTGDSIRVMYNPKDPAGSVSAYSDARFIVPVIILVICIPAIFFIWIQMN